MTPVTSASELVTFGPLDDLSRPLAVLVHGFPDTPHTWRHLGPALAADGYRVVAPWLPGYLGPADSPVTVGTYVHRILELHRELRGDDRALLLAVRDRQHLADVLRTLKRSATVLRVWRIKP